MGVRQVFGLGLMISDPITTADLVTVARTAEKAGFTTLTIGGRETILDPTDNPGRAGGQDRADRAGCGGERRYGSAL